MNLEYVDLEITTWEDLFTGYDRLYAVTYSSSIDFISKLPSKIKEVEIIFGFEKVLNGMYDIMAYQQATLEELRDHYKKKEKKLIEGFNSLLGDTEDTINKYYTFTNWIFVSPDGNNKSDNVNKITIEYHRVTKIKSK